MLKRRSIIQNKKAQVEFSPIILIAVVIGFLVLAPILMRIIGITTGTFFEQMNQTSPGAVSEVTGAVDKVYNFFDYLIVIAIFINVIMLFISAWFIDTNPVFIILYIMFAFIFILFVPNLLDSVDSIWATMESAAASDPWEGSSLNLAFTDWIREHLIIFTTTILALTGIITYAKFKFNSGMY